MVVLCVASYYTMNWICGQGPLWLQASSADWSSQLGRAHVHSWAWELPPDVGSLLWKHTPSHTPSSDRASNHRSILCTPTAGRPYLTWVPATEVLHALLRLPRCNWNMKHPCTWTLCHPWSLCCRDSWSIPSSGNLGQLMGAPAVGTCFLPVPGEPSTRLLTIKCYGIWFTLPVMPPAMHMFSTFTYDFWVKILYQIPTILSYF